MKSSLLVALIIIEIFTGINCSNRSLVTEHNKLIDDCVLYKYKHERVVNKTGGIFAEYQQFVVENVDENEQIENVFYEFIQIFNKTRGQLTCEKIQSLCMVKTVQRRTPMGSSKCYTSRKISMLRSQPLNLRAMFPFESFFDVNETACVELEKKSLEDRGYCGRPLRFGFISFKLDDTLIKETNLWNYFILNTVLCALGLFTNIVCLAVFIHSKYLMPKMGNREAFIVFASSNITYLVTNWFMFTLTPGASSYAFVRDHPALFSVLICKALFYINLSSFFLSELIVCTLSLHRALTVFFPLQLIFLSSKYPRLIPSAFAIFLSLAFLLPFVNLVFNTSLDVNEIQSISEKTNINQYCSIHPLAGNLSMISKVVVAFFMIIALTISSIAIIVKLLMLKQTAKNMDKKMPKDRNFFSAIFSKGSSSKSTTNEEEQTQASVSLVGDSKSGDSKSVLLKTEKLARRKSDAINNMTIVLAVATVFYNLAYLISFYNMDRNRELLKNKDYGSIVVHREVEIIFFQVKFSITGLLFFVSGEIFRTNLYAFCKKSLRLIRCK